jgi:hypothetical protein
MATTPCQPGNTMKTLEVIGLAFESLMFFAVLPALVVFPFFL